jgi:hypothetical protein
MPARFCALTIPREAVRQIQILTVIERRRSTVVARRHR